MLAVLSFAPAFQPPQLHVSQPPAMRARTVGTVMTAVDRRAVLALAPLAFVPNMAVADSIEEIAKRNAAIAAAEKSPEALEKKKDEEKANENGQLIASLAISALLLGSTALSLAPVQENVKRVGQKVKTGKGRNYN